MAAKIDEFRNAVAYPISREWSNQDNTRSIEAGLCLEDGSVPESALHRRHYQYNFPTPTESDPVFMEEPTLFGGFHFFPEFNHTVAESLGRLWAERPLGSRIKKIAFLAGSMKSADAEFPGFFLEIFRMLGIEAEPVIIRRPTRFDRIFVPTQLYGLSCPPQDELMSYFRSRLQIEDTDVVPGRKLFVSRANWPLGKGGIALESELEGFLAENGFEILHPEEVSLAGQFREYGMAEKLLFSEGSALHLYALIAGDNQRVAVLARRKRRGTQAARETILGVRNAIRVDAVVATQSPRHKRNANANAASVIDFRTVARDLTAAGFLDGDVPVRNPSRRRVNETLEKAGFRSVSRFRLLPIVLPARLSPRAARTIHFWYVDVTRSVARARNAVKRMVSGRGGPAGGSRARDRAPVPPSSS